MAWSTACATAMTPRDFGPPTWRRAMAWPVAGRSTVAFVFGSERFGLANDDVYRCHALPVDSHRPEYGSLNLAQAVQLLAYERRQALGGFAVQARTAPPRIADAQAVQGLLAHWQQRAGEARLSRPRGAQEADAAPEPAAAEPRAVAGRGDAHPAGGRQGHRAALLLKVPLAVLLPTLPAPWRPHVQPTA
jgi:hypothetical protein